MSAATHADSSAWFHLVVAIDTTQGTDTDRIKAYINGEAVTFGSTDLPSQNHEYGILKEFAILEKTPNVPGLNLPNIDIVSLSKGYGTYSILIKTLEDFKKEFKKALKFKGVSVIVIPTKKTKGGLKV